MITVFDVVIFCDIVFLYVLKESFTVQHGDGNQQDDWTDHEYAGVYKEAQHAVLEYEFH